MKQLLFCSDTGSFRFFINYLLISFSHCPWFVETEASLSIYEIMGGGVFVCMYSCMYVCMYASMYVHVGPISHVLCMYVSVYVCMYHTYVHNACMYAMNFF